jgi:hypothetical protein
MSGIIGGAGNKSGVVGRLNPSVLQIVTHPQNTVYGGNENSWQTAFTKDIIPKSSNSYIYIKLLVHVHVNPHNNKGATWSIQEGNSIVGDGGTIFGTAITEYLSGNIFWTTSSVHGETWVENTALTTRTFQAKWANAISGITAAAHETGHFQIASGTAPVILQMVEYSY